MNPTAADVAPTPHRSRRRNPSVVFDWGADYYASVLPSPRGQAWSSYHDDLLRVSDILERAQWNFARDPERAARLFRSLAERLRGQWGRFIGTHLPEHLIFTTGTFAGWLILRSALAGVPYAVVTTDHELPQTYGLLQAPVHEGRSRKGFVRVLKLGWPGVEPGAAGSDWDALERQLTGSLLPAIAKLTPKPRLLVLYLSWVTFDLGLHVPVVRLARAAKRWWAREVAKHEDTTGSSFSSTKVLVVVDGSHVFGNVPVSWLLGAEGASRPRLETTPIDVLVGDGHKWLQGPMLSGFLWVRHPLDFAHVVSQVPNFFALPPAATRPSMGLNQSKSLAHIARGVGGALALARFERSIAALASDEPTSGGDLRRPPHRWGDVARQVARLLRQHVEKPSKGLLRVVPVPDASADASRIATSIVAVTTGPGVGEPGFETAVPGLHDFAMFLRQANVRVSCFWRAPWVQWASRTANLRDQQNRGSNDALVLQHPGEQLRSAECSPVQTSGRYHGPPSRRGVLDYFVPEELAAVMVRPLVRFCCSDTLNTTRDLDELGRVLRGWARRSES